FLLILCRPTNSTLFPYTTLFRSLPPRDGFCCGQCHRPQRPETTTETTWQTQAVGNSSKLHPPSTQAKKGFNQLIRSPQPGILPSHRDILKVPPVPNVCATAVA